MPKQIVQIDLYEVEKTVDNHSTAMRGRRLDSRQVMAAVKAMVAHVNIALAEIQKQNK